MTESAFVIGKVFICIGHERGTVNATEKEYVTFWAPFRIRHFFNSSESTDRTSVVFLRIFLNRFFFLCVVALEPLEETLAANFAPLQSEGLTYQWFMSVLPIRFFQSLTKGR
jgi:hypothetical protein